MTDHPLYRKHYADDKTYLGLTMFDRERGLWIGEDPLGNAFICAGHEDGRRALEQRALNEPRDYRPVYLPSTVARSIRPAKAA